MDSAEYKLRKILGTLGQQGDLEAAQAYRTEQAVLAISRGASGREAWLGATKAAAIAYGVRTADLWAASRLGQGRKRGRALPTPKRVPRTATVLGACEDDPTPPDPRFPRRRFR